MPRTGCWNGWLLSGHGNLSEIDTRRPARRLERAWIDSRDAACSGDPDVAVAIAHKFVDDITGKAIGSCEMPYSFRRRIELIETTPRAEIHTACLVFADGPDRVAGQTIAGRVVDESRHLISWILGDGYTFRPQADPQPAAAVLKE